MPGSALSLLLLPIAALALLALLAGRAGRRTDDARAYRAYQRLVGTVYLFGAPAWVIAVQTAGLAVRPLGVGAAALLFVPPLAMLVAASRIVFSTERSVRGIRRAYRTYLASALLSSLPGLLPGVVLAAMGLLGRGEPWLRLPDVAFAIFASIGVAFACLLHQGRRLFPTVVLDSGPLVDAILDVCRRAGVRVNQVVLMSTGEWRIGNALVTRVRGVMATDYLLANLDEDEMVAVVAHELGHVRRHDVTIYTFMSLPLGAFYIGILMWGWLWPSGAHAVAAWTACVAWPLSWLLRFVSRRREYGADADAVRVTGDPRAYIRMLARVAGLNHMPLQPGMYWELTETHPGMTRRIGAVARAAGLSDDDVVAQVAAADRPIVRPEDYPAVAVAVQPEHLLYGPAQRARALRWLRISPMLWLAIGILGDYAAIAGLRRLPPFDSLEALVACVVAVVLAGPALVILLRALARAATRRTLRRVEGALRAKLDEPGAPIAADALHVGVFPGSTPCAYGGDVAWDIGFISLEPGLLLYVGDRTSFSLGACQVDATELRRVRGRRDIHTWIEVRYSTEADGPPKCFGIIVRNPFRGRAAARATTELAARLEAWRASAPADAPASGEGAPPDPDRIVGVPLVKERRARRQTAK